MEDLFARHGILAIVVMLALHLVMRIVQFLFDILKKKNEQAEKNVTEISLALQQNTGAVRELRIQMGILERELGEIHKFKIDTKRLFSAVKIMAGPKWSQVRKAMEDDEI